MKQTLAYQKYAKYLSDIEESPSKTLLDDVNRLERQLRELQSANGELLIGELCRLDAEIKTIDETISDYKQSEDEWKKYKITLTIAWIRFALRIILSIIIVFGVIFIAIFYIFGKIMDNHTRNR